MDKFIAHILVVDDDDGIRSLVKKYLNENNFLVTTANSAEDASEKIKIIKFDLIILDIMMPGMDGFAVAKAIKEDASLAHIPIIFLSAKTDEYSKALGQMNAADYIEKPFEITDLKKRIDEIVG